MAPSTAIRYNPRTNCTLDCTSPSGASNGTNRKQIIPFAGKSDLPLGLYCDGHGLYLQVSAQKTKSWVYRYMIAGRARKMGLRALHSVSLAEARKRASDMHRQIWDGVDPIEARRKMKGELVAALVKGITFRECAEKYIDAHASSWKSARHKQQWSVT